MKDLLDDLAAEHEDLDTLVSGLPAADWDLTTPAEPWTIRDQIGHLAFFDEKAALSARDADGFAADMNTIATIGIDAYMGQHIERGRAGSPAELLAWWRRARSELLEALAACDPEERLLWYGPPMRAASSAVARLMETWAHGLDVADTLGIRRPPTDRLFRVADLGVRTFRFAFENRNLPAPPTRVRVALRGVTGNLRVWNDECADSVTGPVEDFCMAIAQRRHFSDTHLVCEGPIAREWMDIAQVFAGPPGAGRGPRRP
ncbi:MAG: TIGR03084 family metal-binding protein [Acidimicrobiia bacterium]